MNDLKMYNQNILYIQMLGIDYFDVFVACGSKVLSAFQEEATRRESQQIIGVIQNVLKDAGLDLNDIAAVAVAYGAGSFTSNRIGVVTANTLSYSLNIPVVGVEVANNISNDEFIAKVGEIDFPQIGPGHYVDIQYGGEPNIT